MKRTLPLFLLLGLFLPTPPAYAAEPSWQWAQQADVSAPGATASATAVAVDPNGNTYVAGSFEGTVVFGKQTLAASPYPDLFIAKYDAGGNVLWALPIGGNACTAGGLAAGTDRIWLTGSCVHGAGFGGHTLPPNPIYAPTFFLAAIDPAGSFGNVLASEGSGGMTGRAVALDPEGNVLVAGSFYKTPQLQSISLSSDNSSSDAFVFKLDAAQNRLAWLRTGGGPDSDAALTVAAAPDGSVLFAGGIVADVASGSANFGGATLTVSAYNHEDPFIAKLDKNGNWLWARSFPGKGFDRASGVAVDASGHVYVAGRFSTEASFDQVVLHTANGNSTAAFVAGLDADGKVRWAKQASSTSIATADMAYANALSLTPGGNPLIAGGYTGTAAFDSLSLTSSYMADVFAAELNAGDGSFLWAKSAGGSSGNDSAAALAIAADGNIRVAGSFEDSASFDSTFLNVNRPGEWWITDAFLASLSLGGALPPQAPVLSLEARGQEVTASWTTVAGAEGYRLFYAPYPSASPIDSIDLGNTNTLSVVLPSGAAFYVAVKAYNAAGSSDYSNIGYFIVP